MIPIWLDCDPGHDDAVAILLAAKLPQFKLLGISTVFGNAPLSKTTVNAMAVLKAIGEDVPVYSGAGGIIQKLSGDTPNVPDASNASKISADAPKTAASSVTDAHYSEAPSVFAPSIHGESGLDGTSLLPEIKTKIVSDLDATLKAMAAAVREHPDTCLIATGSLTNVAALFERYPDTKRLIKTLSIMGGGFDLGNWTPFAEFNIWCDAQAAKHVLEDDIVSEKTLLCPLNVTHTAIATEQVLSRIKSVGTRTSQMFFELMTFFKDTYETEFGFMDGPPVHDPLSVAVLLQGMVLKERRVGVEVVVEGDKRGMLVETEGGVTVVEEVDLKRFWSLVVGVLEQCK